MIVRDEENNIETLLTSVLDYIDYAVFVDTGSQDSTIHVIKEFCTNHNLPHEIQSREWVDFATNRNQALELARGKCEYIWALDADWEVEVFDPYAFDDLTADCYLFQLSENGKLYYNDRLLKDELDWQWVSPIHEYPKSLQAKRVEKLKGVLVHVRSIGGYTTDRYRRDIQILEGVLEKDPSNEHALFYLGNSYMITGEFENARNFYQRLISIDTPTTHPKLRAERQYLALRRLGDTDKDFDARMKWYDRAQNLLPYRQEALYPMLVILREQNQYQRAYELSKKMLELPQPDDNIAVESYVYEWGILSEYILVCALLGHIQEAYRACERLLTVETLPDDQRDAFSKNIHILKEYL